MNAVVSVIIPVYNVEKYLDRCLESIVGQTYQALEIILVDDGSTDRSPELCEQWALRDARIRVIHKANGGIASARNTGLEAASGDCYMFADSDDYLPPDAVQVLLDRIFADHSDMAVGRIQKVFEDGHTDGSCWAFLRNGCVTGEEFLFGQNGGEQSLVVANGKLYTRALMQGIRFPDMSLGEDTWVFPLIALRCRTVSTVDHLVYCYFQRKDSAVHVRTDTKILDSMRSAQHMAQISLQKGHPDCAARWVTITIQRIQELGDRQAGLELMESLFPKQELRRVLKNTDRATRAKWYLLHCPRLYDGVFGAKRAVTALLERRTKR